MQGGSMHTTAQLFASPTAIDAATTTQCSNKPDSNAIANVFAAYDFTSAAAAPFVLSLPPIEIDHHASAVYESPSFEDVSVVRLNEPEPCNEHLDGSRVCGQAWYTHQLSATDSYSAPFGVFDFDGAGGDELPVNLAIDASTGPTISCSSSSGDNYDNDIHPVANTNTSINNLIASSFDALDSPLAPSTSPTPSPSLRKMSLQWLLMLPGSDPATMFDSDAVVTFASPLQLNHNINDDKYHDDNISATRTRTTACRHSSEIDGSKYSNSRTRAAVGCYGNDEDTSHSHRVANADHRPLDMSDPRNRCSYRKGKCDQPRTYKRNGALHTYCAFHRQRSVENQKTFDAKRRKSAQLYRHRRGDGANTRGSRQRYRTQLDETV